MRLLITADLHYDIARSRMGAVDLAKNVCSQQGDALILVGDTIGAQLEPLAGALKLFDDFGGRKFFVPGNHCLWCRDDENSMDRYLSILPDAVGEWGFEFLDHNPTVMGDCGLVGSIGWYDYSFADESLAIPEDFYREKLSPGAAAYLGRDDLIKAHQETLTQRHMDIGTRWMDGVHVRLGMSDLEFCRMLAKKLDAQLAELSGRVERIVAFVHHLPFAQLLPRDRPDRVAFAAAYLGTGMLGEVLGSYEKVSHVYCGHSHWHGIHEIGHLKVINVGSTYTEKRLEVLDV